MKFCRDALSAAGCATPIGTATLHMSPNRPLNDTSVLAPDLPSRHYRKLIVVATPAQPKGLTQLCFESPVAPAALPAHRIARQYFALRQPYPASVKSPPGH
jgi:hypothetical protein